MGYDHNKDPAKGFPSTLDSPSRHAVAITPDDNNDLPTYVKSLYIGVSGDVTVIPIQQSGPDVPVLFKSHPVGYLPCGVRKVLNAGTTASNIVGLGR